MSTAIIRKAETTRRRRPEYARQVEKCIRAAVMRREGSNGREIADALGYQSTSGAYAAVKFGLEFLQLAEPAETMRMITNSRIERLIQAIWPQAELGDLDAVDRITRLMSEQAKLHGLYAPIKVDLTDEVRVVAEQMGIPYEQALRIAQQTMKSLPARVA